jgi:hypothetical protein
LNLHGGVVGGLCGDGSLAGEFNGFSLSNSGSYILLCGLGFAGTAFGFAAAVVPAFAEPVGIAFAFGCRCNRK